MSVEQCATNSSVATTDTALLEPKGGGATNIETPRQICMFYSAGRYCKFGKRCRNLHNRPEKREDKVDISVETQLDKTEDGTIRPTALPSLEASGQPGQESTKSNKTAQGGQVKSRVCQYFENYGRCRYGNNCRYEHSRPGARYQHSQSQGSGRNRMRQESWNDDDYETEEVVIQGSAKGPASAVPKENLADNFAGLDVKDGRSKPKRALCRYFKKGYCAAGRRCRYRHLRSAIQTTHEDEVPAQPQPGMVDLPAENERKTSPVLRTPVVPVSEYILEEMNEKQLENLRDTEISQLKKRIPVDRLEQLDESEFKIIFHPTDPDWPYDVKTLQFMVYFPRAYPAAAMQVMTPEHQEMPGTVLSYVEYSIIEYVENQFKEKKEAGKVELVFRPFLRWLDKSLEKLFTEGLKQLKKEIAALGSGIECVPFWKLQGTKKPWKFEPEDPSNSDSAEESEPESDSGSEETETETEDSDEEVETKKGDLMDPVKKGTQIRMRSLQLLEGIGTIACMKIKIVVHCSRCKHTCDLKLSANRAVGATCLKCNHQMLVNFRPAMMHQMSHTLGYLDVDGCKATDVVLMDGIFDLGCISCTKTTAVKGYQPGGVKNLWCHSCHQKLSFTAESTFFQELQPAAVDTSNLQVIRKKKRATKDPTILEGTPLPNFGTCKHYKKSFRWLRFPCCGMLYPCDICHDDNEDHEMQFANRMVCGFCSKEQGYATERPCLSCQAVMTKGTKTSHWEGGKGCRDKIKMSKSDQHKYANTNKTTSRRAQHKGKQRPKNTKLRHV